MHAAALQRMETMKVAHPKSAAHIGDIMQIKNVGHLHAKMDDWDHSQVPKAQQEKWGEKVFDHDDHHIYHLTNLTHCENHGEGSEWCTRIKDGVHQKHYLRDGDLYVHYPPDTAKPGEKDHSPSGKRFQFWIPHKTSHEAELQDVSNRSVDAEPHEERHPELAHSPHWNEFRENINPVRKLVHGDRYDRIEAIKNHFAHHEDFGQHLWDKGQDTDVHKAIINLSYESRDSDEIESTEKHFRKFNDSELHYRMAEKTPLASTAKYIHDHASKVGDWDSLDQLSRNKNWHSSKNGVNSSEDQAHVARGLAMHEDDGIRANVLKSANRNTFLHAASGFIEHAKDNHHKADFYNNSNTYIHLGSKLHEMRFLGHDGASDLFRQMHNHPVEGIRAEYVKHNLEDARANPHLKHDQSPSVQEALRWDDADYLHTQDNVHARVQAAKVGNDKHHAILMNDESHRVRSETFKSGSTAIKVAIHSDWKNQPQETRESMVKHIQEMPEAHRKDLTHALYATGKTNNIRTAVLFGDHEIHRQAIHHPDSEIRHDVISSTTDRETLKHAADHDPSDTLKAVARSKLTNLDK